MRGREGDDDTPAGEEKQKTQREISHRSDKEQRAERSDEEEGGLTFRAAAAMVGFGGAGGREAQAIRVRAII